jgi:hypothetical protein
MASNASPPHTANSQPNKPHDQITEEKKTSPPKPEATATSDRPHLIHATPTQMDTQYVNMLLALDSIPRLHNMLAGFFTWVLLAGFVLFPGTFTSLQNANVPAGGEVGREVLGAVAHVPLCVFLFP